MRVTDQQGKFISSLTGADTGGNPKPLCDRVNLALDKGTWTKWHGVLMDLITILGDTEAANHSIHPIEQVHLDAMSRHWTQGATQDDLCKQIMALRLIYDWPALKSVVQICPGVHSEKFKINDLFNVLDMHTPLGHGFRAEESARFLDTRRLLGAKYALKMLLHAMFYIDYQICLESKRSTITQYYDFAVALGKRMQSAGRSRTDGFDRPDFIRGEVAFVSLNYDPIGLWTQFIANRNLNKDPAVPYVGSPAAPLQIFHDMGHFIPSRRIEPNDRPAFWYPMNEASAQRLNEGDGGPNRRIRVSKFLFPHGCFCWRECPDCGKLSAYHGDEWDIASPSLIPPPPLKGFEQRTIYPNIAKLNEAERTARSREKGEWEKGRVDARACLHCGTITSAHNTQTVMQSSFKQVPPSFIDEIQRDLRATVMLADHIIFMGYSLPPDDVTYRSFFAARRHRSMSEERGESTVHCTIIDKVSEKADWIAPSELRRADFREDSAVHSALDIFGTGNVRFFGGGVPDVFLDRAGNVSQERIEQLLTWPTP